MDGALELIKQAGELVPGASVAIAVHATAVQLPVIFYGVGRPGRALHRGGLLAAVAAVVAVLAYLSPGSLRQVVGALVAFLYYLFASLLAYRLRPSVACGRVSRDALFALLLVLFVLGPIWLFRSLGIVSLLVIGWLMVLSVYSYLVDGPATGPRTSFSRFLFFVFVDPSLVYAERARPADTPQPGWRPAGRLLRGLGFMTLGKAGMDMLPGFAQLARAPLEAHGPYPYYLVLGSVTVVVVYWLRAGFVDVKIAFLRLLGYRVSECYIRPFLATSPLEFWRRWNTYVGRGAQRYVFGPLALSLTRSCRRRWPGAPRALPKLVAIIGTFLLIGLLHDVLRVAGNPRMELRFTAAFLFAGGALLAWEGLRQSAKAMGVSSMPLGRKLSPVVGRVAVLHYVAALAAALGGG